MLNGLKGDASYAGLLESVVNRSADFVVVQAFFQRYYQRCRNVVAVKFFDGIETDATQIGAAQFHQRLAFEGIKLQVDFEVVRVRGEAFNEGFVLRNTHAVGVQHQMTDGARFGEVEDSEKVGMHGRLTAGDLDDVRVAFVADYCI